MLGLPHDATPAEVRAAHRRAVRSTHPDLGGTRTAFLEVQAAYEQLTRPATGPAADPPTDEAPEPATEPLGRWRRGFDTAVVQAAATTVMLALRLAASGTVVAALLGLWGALVLLPPAILLWALATATTAWRHRHQPRPTAPQVSRPRRLLRVTAAVACLPLAGMVVAVSIGTWTLLDRAVGLLVAG